MPIERTITLYQYDELSDKAKDKAREWFRRASEGDTFWHEYVEEDAKRMATILGISIDGNGISWSGFSSQGDGASFTGTYQYRPEAVTEIKAEAPQDTELHRIADVLATIGHVEPYADITRISHQYSHPYTVRVTNAETDEDVSALQETLRAFMTWIYRQLEHEYEYQNSDDTVTENIRANEYTFLENGARHD